MRTALIVLLASLLAPAQDCPGAPGKAPWAKPGDRRFLEPVFGEVKVTKDLAYGEAVNDLGQKEVLRLDIYEPQGEAAPLRPAILWLHGGSFQPAFTKEQEGMVALAKHFTRVGYVGISLEYRAQHNQGRALRLVVTDAMNDVMAALAWVRRNATTYRIDAGFLGIAGTSAGGMLSGSFTSRKDLEAAPRDRAGIFAQALFWEQPRHPRLPELWPEIDPCYPPTVFLIGNEDMQSPFTSALAMARDMDKAGVKRRVQIVEGGGHSLEGRQGEFLPMAVRFFHEMLTGVRASLYPAAQYSRMTGGEFRPADAGGVPAGCIEFGERGGYVEWDYVAAGAEGWHMLKLKYANRSGKARGGEVRVNGVSAGKAAFEPGEGDAWRTAAVRVMLRAGDNTVRVVIGPIYPEFLDHGRYPQGPAAYADTVSKKGAAHPTKLDRIRHFRRFLPRWRHRFSCSVVSRRLITATVTEMALVSASRENSSRTRGDRRAPAARASPCTGSRPARKRRLPQRPPYRYVIHIGETQTSSPSACSPRT